MNGSSGSLYPGRFMATHLAVASRSVWYLRNAGIDDELRVIWITPVKSGSSSEPSTATSVSMNSRTEALSNSSVVRRYSRYSLTFLPSQDFCSSPMTLSIVSPSALYATNAEDDAPSSPGETSKWRPQASKRAFTHLPRTNFSPFISLITPSLALNTRCEP